MWSIIRSLKCNKSRDNNLLNHLHKLYDYIYIYIYKRIKKKKNPMIEFNRFLKSNQHKTHQT